MEAAVISRKNLLIFPKTEDDAKLSEELGVLPLIKNQTVRYKLIDADKVDASRTEVPSGKPMMRTPGYTMVGKKIIFDPIASQSVTILNKSIAKTIKTPVGDIKTTRPESIKFLSDKPVVEVKWNEPDKYAFLERADENIDNPFRNKNVTAKYYRVDPRKKVEKELEKDAFEYRAIKWVQEEAKYEQLIACAEYIKKVRPDVKIKTDYKNSEASIGFGLLKRELYELAKTDPKNVLKGTEKMDAHVEMQMRDAEQFQLIMFADGKIIKSKERDQTWFHNDESLSTICVVGLGKNKYEALIEFFTKDPKGDQHYKKIIASLEKMLTPR